MQPSRAEIVRDDNCWYIRYLSGPDKDKLIKAFQGAELPLPFTADAAPAVVLAHIRHHRPDLAVEVEPATLQLAAGGVAKLLWNPDNLIAARELVKQIARLTKDLECPTCGKEGGTPNPQCDDHEVLVINHDDAIATLHGIISKARSIMAEVARG